VVIDVFNHRAIGWSWDGTLKTRLVVCGADSDAAPPAAHHHGSPSRTLLQLPTDACVTLSAPRDSLELLRAGDHEAFSRLFDDSASVVYGFARRRGLGVGEAEDLVQAVFMTAWRTRSKAVLVEDSARPWLLAIAQNCLRNALRSGRRRESLRRRHEAATTSPVADHGDAVAAAVDARRTLGRLPRLLAALPPDQREAFEMCVVRGDSLAEAARSVGAPVGTVKSRLSRARSTLRWLLQSGDRTEPVPATGHSSVEWPTAARGAGGIG